MSLSACPICQKEVPQSILEWHANEHFKVESERPLNKSPRDVPQFLDDGARPPPSTITRSPSLREDARHCPTCGCTVRLSRWALHRSWCGQEARMECPACCEERDVSDMHTFDCPGSHRLCNGCTARLFEVAVRDKCLARCPLCQYVVRSIELCEMRAVICPDLLRRYEEIERLAILGLFTRCPTPNCPFVIDVPVELQNEPHGVACSACQKSMCTLCRSQPYHPGRTCMEAGTLKAAWLSFILKKCNDKMSAAYIADQKNRQLRFAELQQDEAFKAAHCRRCPKCSRVVQKLEGCDAMVCGRDAHGGNEQNGCGYRFRWPDAPKYEPVLPTAPTLDGIDTALLSEHNHGPFHRCVGGHDIVGPRFQCCNCPGESLECCHACLPIVLRGHPPDHYFAILTA